MNQLGEYLKELRGKKSLRDVAKETGISHSYLSTLEKGYDPRTKKVRKPSFDVLKSLASYYGVSYVELLVKAKYLSSERVEKALITDEEAREFIKENNAKNSNIKSITVDTPVDYTTPEGEKRESNSLDILDLYYYLSMPMDHRFKGIKLTDSDKKSIIKFIYKLKGT